MAFKHGKDTNVTINGVDISVFTNNTAFNRAGDSHDVTTYKATPTETAHIFQGGLTQGTCTISGIYDGAAAGPRVTIEPLVGTVVPFIYQPEGTGAGLPQDAVDVLVTAYNETSPVADMITWTAELQLAGEIVTTVQV